MAIGFMKNSSTIKQWLTAMIFIAFAAACSSSKRFTIPVPPAGSNRISGRSFFQMTSSWKWKERDSLAVKEILSGNIPSFLHKFIAVVSEIKDSTGITHRAVFYVSPDYLCIGTDEDWARIPLTPMAAQRIADSFHCFLPTRKMVDLTWQQSAVKPEPIPMYEYRDSSITMYRHHQLIEEQRRKKKGLIAGIKKDLVISGKISRDPKPNRVAIYGWHYQTGKPIQPLYTGHINWYVDYSHGARLVYRNIKVDGKIMDYIDVLNHPVYKYLLCDEEFCDFYRYPY